MANQPSLFARAEIYRILISALIAKKPLPPSDWSIGKFENEVDIAGKVFDPDLFSRHQQAFADCLYYLADFTRTLPEKTDLTTGNPSIHQLCGELADEIEQITYEPEQVIARHGKLKSRLREILQTQTRLLRQKTNELPDEGRPDRAVLGKVRQISQETQKNETQKSVPTDKWKSELARSIFQKVSGQHFANSSEQANLF